MITPVKFQKFHLVSTNHAHRFYNRAGTHLTGGVLPIGLGAAQYPVARSGDGRGPGSGAGAGWVGAEDEDDDVGFLALGGVDGAHPVGGEQVPADLPSAGDDRAEGADDVAAEKPRLVLNYWLAWREKRIEPGMHFASGHEAYAKGARTRWLVEVV
jgi:hypothetical protein